MKTSRVVTAGIVVVAIFLCCFNTVHARPSLWPNNKGEICLKNTGNGEIIRMAVMRTIGNHYIVHGFVTEVSGNKSLFNGNAIVDGNWVLMHVSTSGKSVEGGVGEVHGFIGRVQLDPSTLNGWAEGIGFHCTEDSIDCGFGYDGITVLVPCP